MAVYDADRPAGPGPVFASPPCEPGPARPRSAAAARRVYADRLLGRLKALGFQAGYAQEGYRETWALRVPPGVAAANRYAPVAVRSMWSGPTVLPWAVELHQLASRLCAGVDAYLSRDFGDPEREDSPRSRFRRRVGYSGASDLPWGSRVTEVHLCLPTGDPRHAFLAVDYESRQPARSDGWRPGLERLNPLSGGGGTPNGLRPADLTAGLSPFALAAVLGTRVGPDGRPASYVPPTVSVRAYADVVLDAVEESGCRLTRPHPASWAGLDYPAEDYMLKPGPDGVPTLWVEFWTRCPPLELAATALERERLSRVVRMLLDEGKATAARVHEAAMGKPVRGYNQPSSHFTADDCSWVGALYDKRPAESREYVSGKARSRSCMVFELTPGWRSVAERLGLDVPAAPAGEVAP